jgi:hypothetical protein
MFDAEFFPRPQAHPRLLLISLVGCQVDANAMQGYAAAAAYADEEMRSCEFRSRQNFMPECRIVDVTRVAALGSRFILRVKSTGKPQRRRAGET